MTLPGFATSDGGQANTRFKAPVLSGAISEGAPIGGFMCVQSTAALTTQILTTTGQPTTSAFMYITQGTVGMTSSNTANIAANPPYTGSGAALYFDITRKKLSIFSTGVGDWVSVTLTSS